MTVVVGVAVGVYVLVGLAAASQWIAKRGEWWGAPLVVLFWLPFVVWTARATRGRRD